MTRKIWHTLPEGVTLRLDVNGNTVKTATVPAGKLLTVKVREVALFDAGTRVEVYVGDSKKVDYTVPAGYTIVVETQLEEDNQL